MADLTKLPNIGKILVANLKTIGISEFEDLQGKGTKRTILELLTVPNNGVCINMIYAIEGAIQGIRWHGLNAERKKELLEFYSSIEK